MAPPATLITTDPPPRRRASSRRKSASASRKSSSTSEMPAAATHASRPPKRYKQGKRYVETVIFGDIRFAAWYPSWYPQECGDGKEVLPELYVCPRCFAYSCGEDPETLQAWLRHCAACRRRGVPGEMIYVHGRWRHGSGKVGGDSKTGTWSIREVDGALETLFCQNLSLFAKLFLDNKSVFFDVSSFNYFLLVYTPPAPPKKPNPVSRIIGFFSKEKLSWDNNNLACILVFPPWQRKGLGSLLIGVSYAIARREGIQGGPERPISDLGMKSYRVYWSKEIARFLLRWDGDTEAKVDVELISQETWISPEDCLTILREMDAIEIMEGTDTVSAETGDTEIYTAADESKKNEAQAKERIEVCLDKQRIRDWVAQQGLRLERAVSEEGFKPGYALDRPCTDKT